MINEMKANEGYIYLIKAASEPPRYKIGRTKNYHKRFRRLKECCPFPLRLIKVRKVKDMVLEEKILHEKMDKYRVWGEWFILPPEQVLSINDWFTPPSSLLSPPPSSISTLYSLDIPF